MKKILISLVIFQNIVWCAVQSPKKILCTAISDYPDAIPALLEVNQNPEIRSTPPQENTPLRAAYEKLELALESGDKEKIQSNIKIIALLFWYSKLREDFCPERILADSIWLDYKNIFFHMLKEFPKLVDRRIRIKPNQKALPIVLAHQLNRSEMAKHIAAYDKMSELYL